MAGGEHRSWTFAAVGLLGAGLLRLLHATWRVHGAARPLVLARRAARADGPGTIYVHWHSRIALAAATHSGCGVNALVSRHGDGEYIVRVIERLGFQTIRGSSTRGGGRALLEIVRALTEGLDVAMTPDGPRGPRLLVQQGCVVAAMKARAPIVPIGFERSRAKRLASWDRFVVPWPFTKVAVVHGDPIDVPQGLDEAGVETWRGRIQSALIDVSRRAADLVGVASEIAEVDPRATRAASGV